MALSLNHKITEIAYHFADNYISEAKLSRVCKMIPMDHEFTIYQEVEFRPDLIAKLVFEDEKLDWLLMFITGLTKDEMKYGVKFQYPSWSRLSLYLLK